MMNDADMQTLLQKDATCDAAHAREILSRSRELKGISKEEVLALLSIQDVALLQELFETARWIKEQIYGNRLVLFAPLYISNLCANDCAYCAFRRTNQEINRRSLSQEEIRQETEALIAQGHKRVLLVAGEALQDDGLDFILRSLQSIGQVSTPQGNIRRINVNIAPLSTDDFKRLHAAEIGTYQLFQETYHEATYKRLHQRGPKADYAYRITTMDRALSAGIDDVGIGVLFGLYDWRYEILALLSHIEHLETQFGIGPHTISIPRLEPAHGAPLSEHPPYPVSDIDFQKIIACLRLAVPYTGIILSTRETPAMRKAAFDLGVSQISAGSRTDPGGYAKDDGRSTSPSSSTGEQFSLGDTRPMIEVIRDIVERDHIPSFCTACYRLGRVGKDFMDLAKPGLIKQNCLPNALFTFAEYLMDFADDALRSEGLRVIERTIQNELNGSPLQESVRASLEQVMSGTRDIYL